MRGEPLIYLLVVLAGYLIGSVSVARIVFARLKPGEKPALIRTPTTDGQAELVAHSIGATNVMIAFGPRWGLLTTALDIAKALLPTLLLRLAFPLASYHLVCAVAVLIGHLWPVWYRFVGGGGNSCVIGMLLAISPLGFLATHAASMLIGRLFPMLSFLAGVALMIPWFAWRNGLFSPETAFALVVTLLYVAGQLPEAIKIAQLKKAGHRLDMKHTMSMMKRSAKTGQPGGKVMNQDAEASSRTSDIDGSTSDESGRTSNEHGQTIDP
jgi:glycerol-3-phosphate acyltransferase PlsY